MKQAPGLRAVVGCKSRVVWLPRKKGDGHMAVTWMELLTFVLAVVAIIELTEKLRKS